MPAFLDRLRGAIGLSPSAWLGLVAFVGVGWLLIRVPLAASKEAR